MPTPSEEETRTVEDFAELLGTLAAEGFDFAVIGGCAVGAYAHLRGEAVLTSDLDLIATPAVLDEILEWAPKHGLDVEKRPQPRSIPTAFLVWKGKEINVLTYSHGLPPAEETIQAARVFDLSSHHGMQVPIADCFHLVPTSALAREIEEKTRGIPGLGEDVRRIVQRTAADRVPD